MIYLPTSLRLLISKSRMQNMNADDMTDDSSFDPSSIYVSDVQLSCAPSHFHECRNVFFSLFPFALLDVKALTTHVSNVLMMIFERRRFRSNPRVWRSSSYECVKTEIHELDRSGAMAHGVSRRTATS